MLVNNIRVSLDCYPTKRPLQSVDKRTIEYCIETFPFDDATQKTFSDLIYLSETASPVAPTLDELTEDDLYSGDGLIVPS